MQTRRGWIRWAARQRSTHEGRGITSASWPSLRPSPARLRPRSPSRARPLQARSRRSLVSDRTHSLAPRQPRVRVRRAADSSGGSPSRASCSLAAAPGARTLSLPISTLPHPHPTFQHRQPLRCLCRRPASPLPCTPSPRLHSAARRLTSRGHTHNGHPRSAPGLRRDYELRVRGLGLQIKLC